MVNLSESPSIKFGLFCVKIRKFSGKEIRIFFIV